MRSIAGKIAKAAERTEKLSPTLPDDHPFKEAMRDVRKAPPEPEGPDDFDAIERLNAATELRHELEAAEIDWPRMTDEQVFAAYQGEKLTPNTAARRATVREASRYQTRLERELATEAEKLKEVQKKWDDLQAKKTFRQQYLEAIEKEAGDAERKLKSAKRTLEGGPKKLEEEKAFASADPIELQDMARQIVDHVIGHTPSRPIIDAVPLTRGPLKERTLNIPDERIEDFLDNDIERIARVYSGTMSADVELAKAFGSPNMETAIEGIREDYARMREAETKSLERNEKLGADEKKAKGEKINERLNTRLEKDIENIEGVRDRLRGYYGMPKDPQAMWIRASKAARLINYMRLGGLFTVSSITDVGRPMMVHGFMRTFGHGLRPLVTNLKHFNMAADEAKLAGTALDMELGTRALALGDYERDFGRTSKLERGLQTTAQKYGLLNLLSPWTTAMKRFSAVVSQHRTLEAVEKWGDGTISNSERSRLAQLGIDMPMALRIAKEFQAHGSEDAGAKWANTIEWTDAEARDAFRVALTGEVDRIIVTPGQDKPLWMSNESMKLFGQFKSFTAASLGRVLVSGLQQRDAAFAQGIVFSIGLGMLSVYLKAASAKRTAELPDDPAWWVREGINQSGVLGWLGEANAIGEKWGGVGIGPILGIQESFKRRGLDVEELLGGPSVGLANDLLDISGDALDGRWTESSTRRMRRLLPFQNLFYVRWLFDEMEEGFNEAADVPKQAPKGS